MNTIHVFPAGKSFSYSGEYPSYTIDDNGVERAATQEEAQQIRCQELAEMYVSRDVLCCDSCLIGDLVEQQASVGGLCGFSFDDMENVYTNPEDWTVEECRQWLDDHDVEYDKPAIEFLPDYDSVLNHVSSILGDADFEDGCLNIGIGMDDQGNFSVDWDGVYDSYAFDMDIDEGDTCEAITRSLIDGLKENIEDEFDEDGYLETLKDSVRDNCEPAEPYEWWRVTKWLCEQLRNQGEVVLDNDYGCWWGRQTTGQSMIMDGVFQDIARRHIAMYYDLKGLRHDKAPKD